FMKPAQYLDRAAGWLTQVLGGGPQMPAARLYSDVVLALPHGHPHPPTMGVPLPSMGMVLASGATSVLITGMPAARRGDFGFAAWCGGYFPLFEVLTGSSSVYIGGARQSRQLLDATLHCFPNPLGMMGAVMAAVGAATSAVGVAADLLDMGELDDMAAEA